MSTQRTANVGGDKAPRPAGDRERRPETLTARIERLEGALEGLQDAVYRQAVLEEQKLDEIRRRIAPAQMARELSRDARRRGL